MRATRADSTSGGTVREIELPRGRRLIVRHVRPDDVDRLRELFGSLSDPDRNRRFFTCYRPSDRFLDHLVDIDARGGICLVAAPDGDDDEGQIVAEATCEPLPNGNGELGITVARAWRSWLGPFLLDVLAEEAADRGFPDLEADVLLENRAMLRLLRARGAVVVTREPTIVRMMVGTAGPPTWAGPHDHLRIVMEVPGGWWSPPRPGDGPVEVVTCAGPPSGQERRCPALRGEPCPLVAGADAVVFALRPEDEAARELLVAHARLHPDTPVCAVWPQEAGELPAAVARRIPRLPAHDGQSLLDAVSEITRQRHP
jgi:RimJ/RimL family protein N-acetyltransferase